MYFLQEIKEKYFEYHQTPKLRSMANLFVPPSLSKWSLMKNDLGYAFLTVPTNKYVILRVSKTFSHL